MKKSIVLLLLSYVFFGLISCEYIAIGNPFSKLEDPVLGGSAVGTDQDDDSGGSDSSGSSLSSDKSLTAFSFTHADNSVLSSDISAVIDQTAGTITATVPTDTVVTALTAAFTITGVSVKIGETPQQSGVTSNDFTNPVTYTVTAENGSSRDYNVTVTEPAAVSFSSPPDGSTVNGTVTITGSVSDSGSLAGVYMKGGTSLPDDPSGSDPETDGYINLGDESNWSYVLDTTALADGNHYLKVCALDSADNVSPTQSLHLIINQESDRPIISITNGITDINGDFVDNLLASGAIAGTLTDDDAVDASTIQYRLYAQDGTNMISDWSPPETVGSDGAIVNWSHSLGELSDNFYQVQFRAADIVDGGSYNPAGYGWQETSLIKIAIDTANPDLVIDSPAEGTFIANNQFTISGNAADASGIDSVQVSTNGEGSYQNATLNVNNWMYTCTGLSDGSFTFYVRATDIYGKTTTVNRTVNIDTTSPTITFTTPAGITTDPGDNAPNVTGDVTINGNVSDSSPISSLLFVGGNSQDVSLTGSGTSPWSVFLLNSSHYANSTYSTHISDNIWRFPIQVTATDAAGNVSTQTGYIDIDLDYTSPNIGILKYVPAGTFQRDATPSNTSTITQPYRMSQHEITRAQFYAVMEADPSNVSYSSGETDPVQMVNWYHAIAFCNKLSLEEGLAPVYSVSGVTDWPALPFGNIPTTSSSTWNAATANWSADGYRLPTEMEWLWAAMGGDKDAQTGAMQGGVNVTGYNKPFAGYDGTNTIGDYACYNSNSSSTTHPVGQKLPNELGLYDMSGNVDDWCWDWYAAFPSGSQVDYQGPSTTVRRVSHGGGFGNGDPSCRLDTRLFFLPHHQDPYYGFRVVRP